MNMDNLKWRSVYLICVSSILFIISENSVAQDLRRFNTRDCNAQQRLDLRQANMVLRQLKSELGRDFEWNAVLPRSERRVKRKIRRLVDDMRITCDRPFRSRKDHMYGRGISIGGRIHIFYNNLQDTIAPGDFCFLVEAMAHEFAHWVGMYTGPGHGNGSSPDPEDRDERIWSGNFDPVYKFGVFAYDHCHQRGLATQVYPLPAGTELIVDPCDVTLRPGILGFPRRNFRGCPRHFEAAQNYPDLRVLGWNSMISSIQISGTPWEVCIDPQFMNWCLILDENVDDLSDLGFNNKIKSLRPFTGFPTEGIVVHRDADTTSEHQYFNAHMSNLQGSGINNEISAIVVKSGIWNACKRPNYEGECMIVTPGTRLLPGTGFDNEITSFERLIGPLEGVIIYKDRDRSGASLLISQTVEDLGGSGMKNTVSSVEVLAGRWRLCSKKRGRGSCFDLNAGEVRADLRGTGFNDTIASVERLP